MAAGLIPPAAKPIAYRNTGPKIKPGKAPKALKPIAYRNTSPPGSYPRPAPSGPTKTRPTPAPKQSGGGAPQSLQDIINAIVGPQLANYNQQRSDLNARQAAQRDAWQHLSGQLLSLLQGIPGQVQGTYDQAIHDTSGLSQAAAAGLASANPNAATLANLQAINAPQAQQDAVSTHNADVFGGGSSVLNFLGGTVPAQGLVANRAAAMSLAQQEPLWAGENANQQLAKLLSGQSQDQSSIDQAIAKLRGDAQGQAYGIQGQLRSQALAAQKYAASRSDEAFNRKLKTAQFGLDQTKAGQAFAATRDRSQQGWARIGQTGQQNAIRNLQSDRNYQLALGRFGLAQNAGARAATAAQAKLNGGGYSSSAVIQFRKRAGDIASRAFNGVKTTQTDAYNNKVSGTIHLSYQEAMREGLSKGIPLSVMQYALNSFWTKPGGFQSWETNPTTGKVNKGGGRPVLSYQQRVAKGLEAPGKFGAPPLAGSGGRVSYPLAAKGNIIGRPYQGTHTLYGNWESDNAVDIAAKSGTPVYAVADGTIGSQLGSLGKGGNLSGDRVHLVTAGNEFYYAHLKSYVVRSGQRVKKGQLIGYTGALNHLHIASKNGDPQKILGV